MRTSSPSVPVKDRIDLTDKEKQIFEHLLQVCRHFNLKTQLRVAGGWVRDKLLGKECYDIDIALDGVLGREFCERVNEYLSSAGQEPLGFGVIKRNPKRSKHLETATMRLLDVWIDFVNLRAEDYSKDSRIPTMSFGTAAQDAYRRDLTINSLFYNINTRSVEDFTQKGITHLKAGEIVTPLHPKQTFLDDPLRVLRAIRFGARFGFLLVGELKEAAADDDVIAAIAKKISRERIRSEIDLMITGREPVKAMMHISELQLFWAVFSLPLGVEPPIPEGCDRTCVAYLDSAWRLFGSSSITDSQRRLFFYSALLLPLRNAVYKDNKGNMVRVVNYISATSLKLIVNDAKTVNRMHLASEQFSSLVPAIISDENLCIDEQKETIDVPLASKRRIRLGLLLDEIKELWRPSLVLSLLLYPQDIVPNEDMNERRALFHRVENTILEMGVENVWELKPLVDGKIIMDMLQMKEGGPIVKEWTRKVRQWQLAHPSGSAEECVDWMCEALSKRARTRE